MFKLKIKRKGVILFIVIGTILTVILLATIILTIITSQSRLTKHQIGRIQAYYAAMAGINLAFDRLMAGDAAWPMPGAGTTWTYVICRVAGAGCNVVDGNFPNTCARIEIGLAGNGAPGCVNPPGNVPVCIRSSVTYTTPGY